MNKPELKATIGELYQDYEIAVEERNSNRPYGMGVEEIKPTLEGFIRWCRGWLP